MKENDEELLLTRINFFRDVLNEMSCCCKDFNDEQIITISNYLDRLIVEYMRLINTDSTHSSDHATDNDRID